MKSRSKHIYLERIKRIKFIKTELNRLICNSFEQNKYIPFRNQFTVAMSRDENIKSYSISNWRLYCPTNYSSKLVNKKYMLSRFGFNKVGNALKIPGLMKRGW